MLRAVAGNIRGQRLAFDTAHSCRMRSAREPTVSNTISSTSELVVPQNRTHLLDRPSQEHASSPSVHGPTVAPAHPTFPRVREQSKFRQVPQRTSRLHHSSWSKIRSPGALEKNGNIITRNELHQNPG
eukprot:scaffold1239_cov270-Pavlova_lutheri.AAC.1